MVEQKTSKERACKEASSALDEPRERVVPVFKVAPDEEDVLVCDESGRIIDVIYGC